MSSILSVAYTPSEEYLMRNCSQADVTVAEYVVDPAGGLGLRVFQVLPSYHCKTMDSERILPLELAFDQLRSNTILGQAE